MCLQRRVSNVEKSSVIVGATFSCHLQDLFSLLHRRLCFAVRLRAVWASASMLEPKGFGKRLKFF